MFYKELLDLKNFRFGDVLEGFVETVPVIEDPITEHSQKGYKYEIQSHFPKFIVVLTPCCSIGFKTISLAPLIETLPSFFKLSEIITDFSLLNRPIEKKKLFSPDVWQNKLTPEQKTLYEEEGEKLAHLDFFFYKPHDFFPKYEVKYGTNTFETQFRMVDFKTIYQLKCDLISRNIIHQKILNAKCLELTPIARKELRDKMAFYFGRATEEDKIELGLV